MIKPSLLKICGSIALIPTAAWLHPHPVGAIEFTPPPDQTAPGQASGGASRGSLLFMPPPDNTAPRGTAGGASRGEQPVTAQCTNAAHHPSAESTPCSAIQEASLQPRDPVTVPPRAATPQRAE